MSFALLFYCFFHLETSLSPIALILTSLFIIYNYSHCSIVLFSLIVQFSSALAWLYTSPLTFGNLLYKPLPLKYCQQVIEIPSQNYKLVTCCMYSLEYKYFIPHNSLAFCPPNLTSLSESYIQFWFSLYKFDPVQLYFLKGYTYPDKIHLFSQFFSYLQCFSF